MSRHFSTTFGTTINSLSGCTYKFDPVCRFQKFQDNKNMSTKYLL